MTLLKKILSTARQVLKREKAAEADPHARKPNHSAVAHGHGPVPPADRRARKPDPTAHVGPQAVHGAGEAADADRRPRRPRGGRGRGRGRPPVAEGPVTVAPAPRERAPVAPPRRAAAVAAVPPRPEPLPADSPFRALGLSETALLGVAASGYACPTPIQEQAIPVILAGRDVIGSAQTGTGKTAAFVLPILTRLGGPGRLRCLVLEPTRELAQQVEDNLDKLAPWTGLRHAAFYGGVAYGPQREALERGIDILVATPGRLLDHLEQRSFHLNDLQVLVLDEVDRMMDMGFLPQVRRVVRQCPAQRQTLLFSATVPDAIQTLAGWVLKDPQRIEIGIKRSVADTISHALYPVDAAQKFDLLLALLGTTDYRSVLIFCRTKVGADRIYEWLRAHGHSVGVMHADRTQKQRMEALDAFKEGRTEVLVATDIAARGLDIAGVSHVVNYDIPENPEDYVHRIGRTGRAQREGDAFTLVTWQDESFVQAVEKFIGRKIERKKLPDFAYEKYPDEIVKPGALPAGRSFRFRGRR